MVRAAEVQDIPALIKLFAQQIPETHLMYAEKGFSPNKCAFLTKKSIDQGLAWVYESDGIQGMLLAEKRFNMFSDSIVEAGMNVLFVKPEYRNGIAAGRLIKTFLKKCDEQKIKMVWMGSHISSGLNDAVMKKLGFKLQEKFYLKETI
jgi:hypothetical protein